MSDSLDTLGLLINFETMTRVSDVEKAIVSQTHMESDRAVKSDQDKALYGRIVDAQREARRCFQVGKISESFAVACAAIHLSSNSYKQISDPDIRLNLSHVEEEIQVLVKQILSDPESLSIIVSEMKRSSSESRFTVESIRSNPSHFAFPILRDVPNQDATEPGDCVMINKDVHVSGAILFTKNQPYLVRESANARIDRRNIDVDSNYGRRNLIAAAGSYVNSFWVLRTSILSKQVLWGDFVNGNHIESYGIASLQIRQLLDALGEFTLFSSRDFDDAIESIKASFVAKPLQSEKSSADARFSTAGILFVVIIGLSLLVGLVMIVLGIK